MPGRMSFILVSKVSVLRFPGRAVALVPAAKSSMRMPIEVAKNALEDDPMPKSVYAIAVSNRTLIL
jgi:hypothetical protein